MAIKKDFIADAASAFVDKMMTPTQQQPKQPTAKKKTPTAADAAKEARRQIPVPQRYYSNKDGSEVKVTFMLSTENEAKLRYICFADRKKQKDVINAALRDYIAAYERKNGKIE